MDFQSHSGSFSTKTHKLSHTDTDFSLSTCIQSLYFYEWADEKGIVNPSSENNDQKDKFKI